MSLFFNNSGIYNFNSYTFVSGGITYRCHKFITTQTFVPTLTVTASLLVVAGGGSGGSGIAGGGGGGGGLIYTSSILTSGSLYSVIIGNGGIPAAQTASQGTNGEDSFFSGSGVGLRAFGGGAGGWGSYLNTFIGANSGSSGGSGGGGSAYATLTPTAVNYAGGLSSGSQGSRGGTGSAQIDNSGPPYDTGQAGGGGGGYSISGSNATGSVSGVAVTSLIGGKGGNGYLSAIDGFSKYYAGGGGGGSMSTTGSGDGGLGGGGKGAAKDIGFTLLTVSGSALRDGYPGQTNTGGGGGGAGWSTAGGQPYTFSSTIGGRGGSGIIIVTYPI